MFVYGDRVRMRVDDRTLAHLQRVIVEKLRRREGFHFTWNDGTELGGGRTSVWLHQGATLSFSFDGPVPRQLNVRWLDLLARAANSPTGLRIVPEPVDEPAS